MCNADGWSEKIDSTWWFWCHFFSNYKLMFADVWSSQISIPSVTITINVWISFRGEGKTICYFCLSFEILRRRIKWCLHRRRRTRLVYEQSRRNSPSAGWCVCLCVCVCQALTFLLSKTAHNPSCDSVDMYYVSLGNFISILHFTWIFLIQCSCAFVLFKCFLNLVLQVEQQQKSSELTNELREFIQSQVICSMCLWAGMSVFSSICPLIKYNVENWLKCRQGQSEEISRLKEAKSQVQWGLKLLVYEALSY
jgi:hypothetical protein